MLGFGRRLCKRIFNLKKPENERARVTLGFFNPKKFLIHRRCRAKGCTSGNKVQGTKGAGAGAGAGCRADGGVHLGV